jgi:hypothetical protein
MNAHIGVAIIAGCFVLMAAAYLAYLAASWNQYQEDRASRDSKINELLDRIKPSGPVIVVDPAD